MLKKFEFDHETDIIVKSVMIHPLLSFKFMIRSPNVAIVHINNQWTLDLFLVDVLRYQIKIDAQLKFSPFPVKNFFSVKAFK